MQNFHEPIFITSKNMEILQNNCLRCHAGLIDMQSFVYTEEAPRCVRCHDAVGHGEAAGLGGPMLSLSEELNKRTEER